MNRSLQVFLKFPATGTKGNIPRECFREFMINEQDNWKIPNYDYGRLYETQKQKLYTYKTR